MHIMPLRITDISKVKLIIVMQSYNCYANDDHYG